MRILLSALLLLCSAMAAVDARPKYVILLIGDGMGLSQIALTEAASGQKLAMRRFPAIGLATTYAADRTITCSAAAGTALATGYKTSINTIGMTPDRTAPFRTIAERARDKGMKVGVVSSVSIDHATPAAFYAHVPDRNMYEQIGNQLLESGFDYFAGGSPRWDKRTTLTDAARFEQAALARGYTFADSRLELAAARGKVIATIEMLGRGGYVEGESSLPYAIDRHGVDAENRTSLADFVRRGLELLECDEGFFLMAEGGKIDWACHGNDAPALVHEVLDFSETVTAALDFYAMHPDETLIIVTNDHETGGLALGNRAKGYVSDFGLLMSVNRSNESNAARDSEAGIAWSSNVHTALPATVFAIGSGCENFGGYYDNTDIPKRIATILGL